MGVALVLYVVSGWVMLVFVAVRPWRWRFVRRAVSSYVAALDVKPLLRGPEP